MTTITSSSKYAGLTAMLRHDLRRTRLMSALFFLLEFIALPCSWRSCSSAVRNGDLPCVQLPMHRSTATSRLCCSPW